MCGGARSSATRCSEDLRGAFCAHSRWKGVARRRNMYRFTQHVMTFASTAGLLFSRPALSVADPIRIFVGEQNLNGGGIVGNPQGGVDSATIDAQACRPCVVGETTSFAGFLKGTFFGTFQADGTT